MKRGNSYRIRVSCGYDINGKQVFQMKTWTPEEGMTAAQIKKELQRQTLHSHDEQRHDKSPKGNKIEELSEKLTKIAGQSAGLR